MAEEEMAEAPGKLAKGDHCLACGGVKDLVVFELWLHGKHAGYIRLCSKDYYWANPLDPRMGDPLQAA